MKRKYIFILLIIIVFAGIKTAKADQLQWLTKEQAEKTIAYFEDNEIKRVIIWCACCDNNRMEKVKVTRIYYRKAEDPSYYEVIIEGTGAEGRLINEAVDLAYVHIKKQKKAYCLGKELGFECDPCTKPFKW